MAKCNYSNGLAKAAGLGYLLYALGGNPASACASESQPPSKAYKNFVNLDQTVSEAMLGSSPTNGHPEFGFDKYGNILMSSQFKPKPSNSPYKTAVSALKDNLTLDTVIDISSDILGDNIAGRAMKLDGTKATYTEKDFGKLRQTAYDAYSSAMAKWEQELKSTYDGSRQMSTIERMNLRRRVAEDALNATGRMIGAIILWNGYFEAKEMPDSTRQLVCELNEQVKDKLNNYLSAFDGYFVSELPKLREELNAQIQRKGQAQGLPLDKIPGDWLIPLFNLDDAIEAHRAISWQIGEINAGNLDPKITSEGQLRQD